MKFIYSYKNNDKISERVLHEAGILSRNCTIHLVNLVLIKLTKHFRKYYSKLGK